MSIKSILLIFNGNDTEIATVEYAIKMAKKFECRLKCLNISESPVFLTSSGFGMTGHLREHFISEMEEEIGIKARSAREKFYSLCENNNLAIADSINGRAAIHNAIFVHETGVMHEILLNHSRTADIVIFPRFLRESDNDLSDCFDALMFHSKKPVLLPSANAVNHGKIANNIALAWNNSDESMAVLSLGLPLMKSANHVHLFSVSDEDESHELSALTEYISWHGIKLTPHVITKGKLDNYQIISNFYNENKIDLLLMGAYSHSKLRQKILGGVTTSILESDFINVMMSH